MDQSTFNLKVTMGGKPLLMMAKWKDEDRVL